MERLWKYIFCGAEREVEATRPVTIYCGYSDPRWRGFIDTLFLKDDRLEEVSSDTPPDIVATSSFHEALDINASQSVRAVIFLDLADSGADRIDPGIQEVIGAGIPCVYIKLQVYSPEWYDRFKGLDSLAVISCPLLLGGSAQYLCRPGNDEENLFCRNLIQNPKQYLYDYSFFGAGSYPDRDNALSILDSSKDRLSHLRGYVQVTRSGHLDARIDADIPYQKLMQLMRWTRVNISLNGFGVWCLKDGELFSRNCFNLRQYHEVLFLNPLSPKDGIHWVVFKNEELEEKILYYVNNPLERETINDAGFRYFARGINGDWATYYVDRLLAYVQSGRRSALGDLLVCP